LISRVKLWMWTEQLESMLVLVIMAALLRTSYELSRPESSICRAEGFLPQTEAQQEWDDLTPWQKETSARAVKRYAAAQERKWRRWNEAMFERVS
jgi:hypothetical protein